MNSIPEYNFNGYEVAVISLSGRFPSANSPEALFQLLKDAKEGLTTFTRDELRSAGVSEELLENPNYIRKYGYFENKNIFDAALFGYSARQAALLDPQFAIFHECVWEALERAGYLGDEYSGSIGVYAGASDNFSWLSRLSKHGGSLAEFFDSFIMTGTDFLCSRVAYKLNLRGPALGVQTACSTSLVNIHLACQGLIAGECDIAVAGGVTVTPKGPTGYLHQDGMILSSDGQCRPFDSHGSGIVDGEGAGVVVLKCLDKAIEDRDNILAVIKGSAINNDGSAKVGYTAPSVEGQAEVIRTAQDMAEVSPDSITYVEAHGTGTPLGDPIEIKALTKAFNSKRRKFCKIGSLKSNIGHLDAAAGVAGFIKTVQMLMHKQIPATLHFETPNPNIDFENSPFEVNAELCEWKTENGPRRAGVSSFGIGGTNAHVVIEESCFDVKTGGTRKSQIILLSANTETALEHISSDLYRYIEHRTDISLADLCYTLHVGRKLLPYRKAFTASSLEEMRNVLCSRNTSTGAIASGYVSADSHRTCFLFPGQGAQYCDMGRRLYEEEGFFRNQLDDCFAIASRISDIDFKTIVFPEGESTEINRTANAQPLLFMFEYSLAQLLMHWGCKPDIMIGHSLGEYVAACVAGVFGLEDAIRLTIRRGALMQDLEAGDMLAIRTNEGTIRPLLETINDSHVKICIAAINSPNNVVVSGDQDAIAALQAILDKKQIHYSLLRTSHAFHSHHMEPALDRFRMVLESIEYSTPLIPYVSNVTGELITPEEATSPSYWTGHLRNCVRFSKGVERLLQYQKVTFLEVGPGKALSTFVVQNPLRSDRQKCVSLIPGAKADVHEQSDQTLLLNGLCQLIVSGAALNWTSFYAGEERGRIPLPTYPFEGKAYWEPGSEPSITLEPTRDAVKRSDRTNWFYLPSWEFISDAPPARKQSPFQCWIIFEDECGFGREIIAQLNKGLEGVTVVRVLKGKAFKKVDTGIYQIDPEDRKDYSKLVEIVTSLASSCIHILHLWSVYVPPPGDTVSKRLAQAQLHGFNSVVLLTQALNLYSNGERSHITVVTNDVHQVSARTTCYPEKAGVIGLSKVIPQEFPNISCRAIDIQIEDNGSWKGDLDPAQLMAELLSPKYSSVTAVRNGGLWKLLFNPFAVPAQSKALGLRKNGVYLITGGLGNIGMRLATFLATKYHARIILTSRSRFPLRSRWDSILAGNEESVHKEKIGLIKDLEKQGGKVDVLSTDVSNLEEMNDLFQWIDQNHGGTNGVIHAAAEIDLTLVEELNSGETERYFSAKVQGTENIALCLKDRPADFVMLCSSLSTVLGGIGFSTYSAANWIMDSITQIIASSSDKTPWICVNWDGWDFNDSEVDTIKSPAEQFSFSPDEGMDLIERLVNLYALRHHAILAAPQVVISTGDLSARYKTYVIENFRSREEEVLSDALRTAHDRPETSTNYVAAETEAEHRLVDIWSRLLGLSEIGVMDDIFLLGADSISTIQAIASINERFGVKFKLGELSKLNCVRSQAEEIVEQQRQSTGLQSLTKAKAEAKIEPSYIQKYFLSLIQQEGAENCFHMPMALMIRGVINQSALRSSLEILMDRHECLKMEFNKTDNKLLLSINDEAKLQYSVMDLTLKDQIIPESGDLLTAEANIILAKQLERNFNLSNAPLFRVFLVIMSDEQSILMIDFHHLVGDHWSKGIIKRELELCYKAYCHGEDVDLPEIGIQYSDYAYHQKQWHHTSEYQRQLGYWQEMFEDYPFEQTFPYDFPRGSRRNFRQLSTTFSIEDDTQKRIRTYCRMTSVNPATLFLAVFFLTLYQHSRLKTLVVCSYVADRSHADLQNVVGLFLNVLPIRIDVIDSMVLEDFVKMVDKVVSSAHSNSDVNIGAITENRKIDERLDKHLGIDYNYINFDNEEIWDLHGLEAKTYTPDVFYAQDTSDLSLLLQQSSEGISGVIMHNTTLFKTETIHVLVENYKKVLISVLEDSGENVAGDIL